MQLAVLTKYDSLAASTRQRFMQYERFYSNQGIELTFFPLLENNYLSTLFARDQKSLFAAAHGYAKRIRLMRTLRSWDGILVHSELLPYAPSWLESTMMRRFRCVIFDYDDAIFHQYDQHRSSIIRAVLGGKLKPLLRRADLAICGNAYLQTYAVEYCRQTAIVPTVVDTDVYGPAPALQPGRSVTIGWIGSPSTWAFVRPLVPLLAEMAERLDLAIRIVGAGPQSDPPPRFTFLPWSDAREIALIQGMDIGIMPLPDEPWARGKCGYKLIQYMACGLPVIASPVGVNADIVDHGENGLLASTLNEWAESISVLAGDANLRQAMGAAGRRKIEGTYSLAVHGPRLAGMLRKVMEEASEHRSINCARS